MPANTISAEDLMRKKIEDDARLMENYRQYLKASNPNFTDEDIRSIVGDLGSQQAKYREQEYRNGQEVTLRAEEIPFPGQQPRPHVPVTVIPPHVPVTVIGEEEYKDKDKKRPGLVPPRTPRPPSSYLESVVANIYSRK
jgi:hypothetical protein